MADVRQVFELVVEVDANRLRPFESDLQKTAQAVGEVSKSFEGIGRSAVAAFSAPVKDLQRFKDGLDSVVRSTQNLKQQTRQGLFAGDERELDRVIRKFRDLSRVVQESLTRQQTASPLLGALRDLLGGLDAAQRRVEPFSRALAALGTAADQVRGKLREAAVQGISEFTREQQTSARANARAAEVVQSTIAVYGEQGQAIRNAGAILRQLTAFLRTDAGRALEGNTTALRNYAIAWEQAGQVARAASVQLNAATRLQQENLASAIAGPAARGAATDAGLGIEQEIRLYRELAQEIRRSNLGRTEAAQLARTLAQTYKAEAAGVAELEQRQKQLAQAAREAEQAQQGTDAQRNATRRIKLEQELLSVILRRNDVEKLLVQNSKEVQAALSDVITRTLQYGRSNQEAAQDLNQLVNQIIRADAAVDGASDGVDRLAFNQRRLSASSQAVLSAMRRIGPTVEQVRAEYEKSGRSGVNFAQILDRVSKELAEGQIAVDQYARRIRTLAEIQQRTAQLAPNSLGIGNLGQIFLLNQFAERTINSLVQLGRAFGDFEQQLAEVRKTADATIEATELLGRELLSLGQDLAVPAEELAAIAGILGQVGAIQFTGNAEEFAQQTRDLVELVGEVAIATDLSSEEAAKSFGRLNAIFASDIRRIRGELRALTGDSASAAEALRVIVGSFNEISNSTTATVGDIQQFVRAFGGVAVSAGVTVEQVAALSGAIGDLGVSQQVAGTALSRLFADAQKRAAVFADAIGQTEEQFRAAFNTDSFGTLLTFLRALNQASRERREEILSGLAAEQRFRNTLLKLADGYELVNRNVEIASDTQRNLTSIQEEATKFNNVFNAQLIKLANGFTRLGVAFEPFFRIIGDAASSLGDILVTISDFLDTTGLLGDTIVVLAGFAAGLFGVVTAIGAFTASLSFVIQGVGQFENRLTALQAVGALASSGFKELAAVLGINRVAATNLAAAENALQSEIAETTAVASAQTAVLQANSAAKGQNVAATGAAAGAAGAATGRFARFGSALLSVASAAAGVGLALNSLGDEESGTNWLGVLTGAALVLPSVIQGFTLLKGLVTAISGGVLALGGAIAAAVAGLSVAATSAVTTARLAGDGYEEAIDRAARGQAGFFEQAANAFALYIDGLSEGEDALERFARAVQERREEIAGGQLVDNALTVLFEDAAKAAGVAEEQINEALGEIAKGTVGVVDAFTRLDEAVERAAGTGELVLDLSPKINFDDEEANRQLQRDIAILNRSLTDQDLGVGPDRDREQALQIRRIREIERLRSEITQALTDQGLGETEINDLLRDRGQSLRDLIILGREQANIATGFTQGDSLIRISQERIQAERLLRLREAQEDLRQRAVIAEKARIEALARQEEKQLTLNDLLEVEIDKLKTADEVRKFQVDLSTLLRRETRTREESLAKIREEVVAQERQLQLARATADETREILDLRRQRLDNTDNEEERAALSREILDIEKQLITEQQVVEQLLSGQTALQSELNNLTEAYQANLREANNRLRETTNLYFDILEVARASGQVFAADSLVTGAAALADLERQNLEARAQNFEDFAARRELLEAEFRDRVKELSAEGIGSEEQANAIAVQLREQLSRRLIALAQEEVEERRKLVVDQAKLEEQLLQDSAADDSRVRQLIRQANEEQFKIFQRLANEAKKFNDALQGLRRSAGLDAVDEQFESIRETILQVSDALKTVRDDADRTEVVVTGLEAIEQASLDAGRALGKLIVDTERIEQSLLETANTAKGRFAREFLGAIRRIASDDSLEEVQRGILLEKTLARFREQFGELDGEGPSERDILSLAERIIAADGQRLQTSRQLTQEAENRTQSLREQFDLSKREAREVEKLQARLEDLREKEEDAQLAGRERTAERAGRRAAAIEERLREILGEQFESVRETDDVRAAQDRANLVQEKLNTLRDEEVAASRALQNELLKVKNTLEANLVPFDTLSQTIASSAGNVNAIAEAFSRLNESTGNLAPAIDVEAFRSQASQIAQSIITVPNILEGFNEALATEARRLQESTGQLAEEFNRGVSSILENQRLSKSNVDDATRIAQNLRRRTDQLNRELEIARAGNGE